jgi:hypothetical protein
MVLGYLAFSALAITALIIIVSILAGRTSSVSASNTRLIAGQQASNIAQCRQGNVVRQQDIAIWNQFLADLAPPGVPLPPKERAELVQINRLIRIKDTPRNCSAAFAGV